MAMNVETQKFDIEFVDCGNLTKIKQEHDDEEEKASNCYQVVDSVQNLIQQECNEINEYKKEISSEIRIKEESEETTDDEQAFDGKQYNSENGSEGSDTTGHTYECEQCTKVFNSSSDLNMHSCAHTDQKSIQCEHTSFTSKHLQSNTEDKPFECEYCKKIFNHSSTLKTHLRIHTDEKRFKCEYCKKTFYHSGNLNSHLRVHIGEKSFKCEYCDKTFNHSGNLKTHLRIHTGEKPFKCEYCRKTFNQSFSWKRHLRKHTG